MQTSAHSNPASRLTLLRSAMRAQHIDALIVPSADPHLSEYLPARGRARVASGFTGSVGTLVVTQDVAGVWTDGRYWEQAEDELAGSGIILKKIPSGASVLYIDWLGETMQPGQTVAVDGAVLGLANARLLQQALGEQVTLRTDTDVLQAVWPDRPAMPAAPVVEHAAAYPSLSRTQKLAALRAGMAAHGASHHVISTLDDIAYLFNLRGADVS